METLCASSATLKAAVVSAETFNAMAKPKTAAVALMLIEKGLKVDDAVLGPLTKCDGGTSLLDALVVSKLPECAKLVDVLIAASPGLASSAIVAAACAKPPHSELALRLLNANPTATLWACCPTP